MTYAEIIRRVLANTSNLGTKEPSYLETMKDDIADEINALYRKAEPIKQELETDIAITTESQESDMPEDLFIPREVLFYNSEGHRFAAKELQYEEYMRWNPSAEGETTSFAELVDISLTPVAEVYTQENADFDGLVGYTFTDSYPQKLLWKPAITGSAKVFYSVAYDFTALTDLTESPVFNRVYHDLIVIGATIRRLTRILTTITDQIQLFAVQTALKHYKEQRTELLKDFIGFVNTNVSTPAVEPWDFLNNYNDLIL